MTLLLRSLSPPRHIELPFLAAGEVPAELARCSFVRRACIPPHFGEFLFRAWTSPQHNELSFLELVKKVDFRAPRPTLSHAPAFACSALLPKLSWRHAGNPFEGAGKIVGPRITKLKGNSPDR